MGGPVAASRFHQMYEGQPPWDIGRPQGVFVALAERGEVVGPVLDLGCGTGEQALMLAARGLEVTGIDLVPRALELALAKARERGLAVTFQLGDALELEGLGGFRTVIDSAVFHGFDDAERARLVQALHRVLVPGGWLFMLVFSDREPDDWGGPRRIRRDELEAAFGDGWRIASIVPARLETNHHADGGEAWFASIQKLPAA